MQVDSDLTFTIPGRSEICNGTVNDLSAAGISFNTDEAIEEKTELTVLLTPANNITPPMEARIIVNRVIERGSEFELACEITEIM